jgi:hypothetical protein
VPRHLSPRGRGRFLLHEYEGSFQGKPLSGMAFIAYHLDLERYGVAWLDRFHTGTALMFSTGASPGGPGLSVPGSYRAPTGPPWGWRTELHQPQPDQLVITHSGACPPAEGRAGARYQRTMYVHWVPPRSRHCWGSWVKWTKKESRGRKRSAMASMMPSSRWHG